MLPDAKVQVAPRPGVRFKIASSVDVGVRAGGHVRGTAHQLGKMGCERVDYLAASGAGSQGSLVRAERGEVSVPPWRELTLHDPLELRGQFGIFLGIDPELGLPLRLLRRSASRERAEVFQGL